MCYCCTTSLPSCALLKLTHLMFKHLGFRARAPFSAILNLNPTYSEIEAVNCRLP